MDNGSYACFDLKESLTLDLAHKSLILHSCNATFDYIRERNVVQLLYTPFSEIP